MDGLNYNYKSVISSEVRRQLNHSCEQDKKHRTRRTTNKTEDFRGPGILEYRTELFKWSYWEYKSKMTRKKCPGKPRTQLSRLMDLNL